MNNLFQKIILLLLLVTLSNKAMGACTVGVPTININVPGSIAINPAAVANGAPLTGWIGLTTTDRIFRCTDPAAWQIERIIGLGDSVAGTYTEEGRNYTIYSTGVAGVGVVVGVRDPNQTFGFYSVEANVPKPVIACACAVWGLVSQARFIKTGNIPAGTLSVARRHVATLRIAPLSSEIYINGTTLNVSAPTCSLSAGDVNRTITLDSFQLKNIPSGGSFGSKTFSISANCSNATNGHFLFQGTPWPSDGDRFNNRGTATGVGIQLASTINGQSLTVPAGGGASSRTRTVAVTNGTATLSMVAAYWRVGAVTPGTVSTAITVTLSYD